jgi:hypothetical protein
MEITAEILRYAEHMPNGDDLTLITLKGHLLIEEILERIIRTIVAHGELLDDARLSFAQKTALARSMCWTKHDSDMWDLIVSINSLRNEFAHQLASPKVDSKLQRTIDLFLQSLEKPESRREKTALPRAQQLKDAIVYCMGFLGQYERDARGYRRMVDSLTNASYGLPPERWST